jgi:predicted kinase
MPTLHLVCGLPGAGKTTLAMQLERESVAVRLCPDEWILELLPQNYTVEDRDRLRDPVESLQWTLTERLLSIGVDVIIEWGFWIRSERDRLREQGRALGASVKLHYLDVPLDELERRIEARNAERPDGSFHVSIGDLRNWHRDFEAPDVAELALFDE